MHQALHQQAKSLHHCIQEQALKQLLPFFHPALQYTEVCHPWQALHTFQPLVLKYHRFHQLKVDNNDSSFRQYLHILLHRSRHFDYMPHR